MHAMPVKRLYQLPRERRRALFRAVATLTAASAAVALLPFRMAIRFGSIPLKARGTLSPEDCVWAIDAASRRLAWPTLCIQKGLAAQRMLRSDGVDAVLHYGARRKAGSGNLEAHVWVSVGGIVIVGGEEADGFAEVAVFP